MDRIAVAYESPESADAAVVEQKCAAKGILLPRPARPGVGSSAPDLVAENVVRRCRCCEDSNTIPSDDDGERRATGLGATTVVFTAELLARVTSFLVGSMYADHLAGRSFGVTWEADVIDGLMEGTLTAWRSREKPDLAAARPGVLFPRQLDGKTPSRARVSRKLRLGGWLMQDLPTAPPVRVATRETACRVRSCPPTHGRARARGPSRRAQWLDVPGSGQTRRP